MANWKKAKLGDIADMCLGKMLDKEKNKGEFHPYLANINVRWGSFDLANLNQMRFEEDEHDRYGLKFGDIVVCEGGEPGRCAIWKEEVPDMKFQKALHRLRITGDYSNEFVYYRLLLAGKRGELDKHFIGSTIKHLTGIGLKEVEFAYPSFKDQQKIAAVLTALDAKIELNARINAELESMAKTLYDYWFVQFAPHKSAGGKMVWNEALKREIPLGWEVCELSKITSRIGTGLNPRKNFVLGNGNNYYVTIKNIGYGKVVLDERCDKVDDEALQIIDRRSDLQIGDILFTSIEPVGKTYLLQEKPVNWNINESVFTIRPNYEFVTSEYLYFLLSSDTIKVFTEKSSAGSTFKGIRIGVLNTFLSVLPDKDTISKFSEIVKPILKKIDALQKESQTLTELRDWLLPMLMNGQVRV